MARTTSSIRSRERSLLHVLREELGLLAAKPGCGEGACGACTILQDGSPIRSCVQPIAEAEGHDVATLEGVREEPVWAEVIAAFVEVRAFQCGYCTPGMVIAAGALLRVNSTPSDADIDAALSGNVCRCGTYPRIRSAIKQAAEHLASKADWKPGVDLSAQPDPTEYSVRPAKPWDLVEPRERDYFERLGDGLVVVLTPAEAERVNEERGGAWSTDGGAWLHVGANGRITAFTGKVDVGQDNRTALGLLVAEELGVSPDVVYLVMGDTDFCPADIGTFGSRSTEDAGGVLRAAAATACEWLRTKRADRPTAGAGFAELVAHERRIVFAKGDAPTRTPANWTIAGRAVARRNAPAIARGDARYPTDIALPAMLHGRAIRAPSHGAELVSAGLQLRPQSPGAPTYQAPHLVPVFWATEDWLLDLRSKPYWGLKVKRDLTFFVSCFAVFADRGSTSKGGPTQADD